MPAGARKLALSFWAGPLTLILQKKPEVRISSPPDCPTSRCACPSHRVARALMEMAGIPIAAPSANRFSRPSPTTAAHVHRGPRGRVDLILDAGPTDIGLESTIVDFSVDPPVLRRPGGITLEQVQSLVPEVVAADGRGGCRRAAAGARPDDSPLRAPGDADLVSRGRRIGSSSGIAADARTAVAQGSRVGILAPEEDLMALAPVIAAAAAAGRDRGASIRIAGRDIERAGRELFAAIRALDATGVDVIFASSRR